MNTKLGGNKEQNSDLGISSNPEQRSRGTIGNDQLLANKDNNPAESQPEQSDNANNSEETTGDEQQPESEKNLS
ncbi:hypothetical protein IEQ34_008945 [Dendrobium chrysotoxum]|uniref:Uncharacterized protein n=1 Tax=Dendrobium chrysotoxum TaxID=161865 RepID=A0AAV7GHV6_DENCH|nr:hypothetical protein IEQ34_008945 [Dendrobium chrysotoxum]